MLSSINVRSKFVAFVRLWQNAQHQSMADRWKDIAVRKSWTECETLRNRQHPKKTSIPVSILWSVRLPAQRDTVSSGRVGVGFGGYVFRNTWYPPYKISWYFCLMGKNAVCQRDAHYHQSKRVLSAFIYRFWIYVMLLTDVLKTLCFQHADTNTL